MFLTSGDIRIAGKTAVAVTGGFSIASLLMTLAGSTTISIGPGVLGEATIAGSTTMVVDWLTRPDPLTLAGQTTISVLPRVRLPENNLPFPHIDDDTKGLLRPLRLDPSLELQLERFVSVSGRLNLLTPAVPPSILPASRAVDASGNGRHGTYDAGVVKQQPGLVALDPDTSIDPTDVSTGIDVSSALNGLTGSLTVEAVVKIMASGTRYLFDVRPTTGDPNFIWAIGNGTAGGADDASYWFGTGWNAFDTDWDMYGQTKHVALTWNAGTNELKMWVDGVAFGNVFTFTMPSFASKIIKIAVHGAYHDEYAVYNRVVPASELLDHAGKVGTRGYAYAVQASKPYAYWRLGEGAADDTVSGELTWDESYLYLQTGSTLKQIALVPQGTAPAGDFLTLAVGSADQLLVGSDGDLDKIKNVPYSWPSGQGAANTVLINDGAGGLSWGAAPVSSVAWSALTAPTAGLSLNHGIHKTTFSWATDAGAGALLKLVGGGGTTAGPVLSVETAAGSTADLFQAWAAGTKVAEITDTGDLHASRVAVANFATVPRARITADIGEVSTPGNLTQSVIQGIGAGTAGNLVQLALGFGNPASPLTHAPVAFGARTVTATGSRDGEFWVATRSVTTDTAPTIRAIVTNAGGLKVGASATEFEVGPNGLVTLASLTASRAVVTDAGKGLVSSTATATEVGYLSGVTSAIQAQLNGKQALDATLTALAAYNTNGLLTQTAEDTFVGRTITGGTGVTVTNGSGVAGDPMVAIGQSVATTASPTFAGLTLTGATLLNYTRPELQLLTSGTAKARLLQPVANSLYLSHNLGFDGTNWNLDDTAQIGNVYLSNASRAFSVFTATAGANPRTLTELFTVNTSGVVTAGTWQGAAVGLAYGGTGATTAPAARTNLGLGTGDSPTFAGLTLTGATLLNYTRPELQLLTSGTAKARLLQPVANSLYLSHNLGFDGTNWNLDDTAQIGNVYLSNASRAFSVFTATAGANPRTLTELFTVGISGDTTIQKGLSVLLGLNIGTATGAGIGEGRLSGALYVGGDAAGLANYVTYTKIENIATARSTGIGTIKFADATSRDNVGFLKVMIGTVAYYLPLFAAN